MFGALFTRARPLPRWLHLGSLVWGVLVEILPWPCPLTPAENWLRTRAGIGSYQGGFLLHYLDALVYPDVPPGLLTIGGVAVCLFNLGIYACASGDGTSLAGKPDSAVLDRLLPENRHQLGSSQWEFAIRGEGTRSNQVSESGSGSFADE